ncbi:hypothetical protein BHE97_10500 [Aeromicrobium sp. PE09-221]|nr:hypothetical protein BHE97_10500 [Aeromicrobium sp. PE09-221]
MIREVRVDWMRHYAVLFEDPYALMRAQPVVVPKRLTEAHQVAREYRDAPDFPCVSKAHLGRAVRVVHALALALKDVGIQLTLDPGRGPQRFTARLGSWSESFQILERPGTGGERMPYSYRGSQGQHLPAWLATADTVCRHGEIGHRHFGPIYDRPTGMRARIGGTTTRALGDILPEWFVRSGVHSGCASSSTKRKSDARNSPTLTGSTRSTRLQYERAESVEGSG